MKELTIEQKAKAYDEAKSIMEEYLKSGNAGVIAENTIKKAFPELKESEDEKIKDRLVTLVRLNDREQFVSFENTPLNHIIAWLEKQGEQKPAEEYNITGVGSKHAEGKLGEMIKKMKSDKAEPKFHEGDWIFIEEIKGYKVGAYQIKSVDEYGYHFDEYHTMPLQDEDLMSLWTIQDVKDGDVLHASSFSSDCIFIFDKLDKWKFDEPNGDRVVATGHCCLTLSADNMEFGIQGPDCIEVDTVKPATKIQRDLLFKTMADAGYTFDFEKKKLKKIEQKTAWSEEDETKLKTACALIRNTNLKENEGIVDSTIIWLKSLKDRVNRVKNR